MVEPISAGLLEIAEDGLPTLLGGFSASSGRYHFPRGEVCPYTGVDDVELVRLSRRGSLWGWTSVNSAPAGYHGSVPYGFGIVELPEGLRVVTRLTQADPARLRFGEPMVLRVEIVPAADGEALVWTFASEEA